MEQAFQELTHAASFSRHRYLVAMSVVTTGTRSLSSTDDGTSSMEDSQYVPITPVM